MFYDFLSWTLTTHSTAGKVREPFMFLSTIFTCPRTFTYLFFFMHVRCKYLSDILCKIFYYFSENKWIKICSTDFQIPCLTLWSNWYMVNEMSWFFSAIIFFSFTSNYIFLALGWSQHKTKLMVDLILTNRKYLCKYTLSYETGRKDHHQMIYGMLKSHS